MAKLTPEGRVKRDIKNIFKQYDVWYFMPSTFGMGRSGVPDFIACVSGKFLAVEAKAGKGKTTVLQDREIAAIGAAGGLALVINEFNLNDIVEAIVHIRNGD